MSEELQSRRGERVAGAAGLALIALTAVGSLWLARPPRPLPADAATARFAAGRAMADVAELARGPRPIGSPAHAAARRFLLGRMAELGLAPEVQETTVARRLDEGRIRAARVRNLVGRRQGTGGGGAVLLVAHYDSRPNTPGAGDDASGVAVVLEVVRALAAGPPLARDLIVLLSDGEELGLLGGRAFVSEHPWLEEVELVLNFEARGSRGPVAMFETGRADLNLVRLFARAAPRPLASSLSAELYARMPNDTDFSAFRAHGVSGLNFAFLGGLGSYHTALDTADRLDPASLQHAGANAVALIRRLDGAPPPGPAVGGVWFNPRGGRLVVLPAGAAPPLAAALAGMTLALAVLGVRSGRFHGRALWSGALLCLAALLVAPLAGAALWKLFSNGAAALLETPFGLPHRLGATGAALLAAGLAAVAALGGLWRRLRPAEAALGVALSWAFLALLTAVSAPGASFLFWWPLGGLVAALAVVVALDPPRPAAVLLLSAGALPGVALLAPLAVLVFQALTPRLAAAAMAPSALLVALALPALLAAADGRQGLSLAALVACLAALAVAVWGAPDAERPRVADLVRVEELDEGVAFRLSRDERLHPWITRQLGGEPQPWRAPSYLDFPERPVWRGPSGPAGASGPQVLAVADLRRGGRRLTVRTSSPEGAPMLWVEAISTVQITAVELAGERFERAGDDATRPVLLELAGLPPEGLEVRFELPDRWPVELHVTEQFYGLSAAPPPELIPSTAWTSHSRLVHRSFLR
jgi:hypothetical protein